jgi:hypothetical protein
LAGGLRPHIFTSIRAAFPYGRLPNCRQRFSYAEVCASQIWGVLARHAFVVCCTGAPLNVLRAPLRPRTGQYLLRNLLILIQEKNIKK